MSALNDQLAQVLRTVRTPGEFHASGICEMRLPHLEVEGLGVLALPVLPPQARQLIKVAEQAPFGRGADTLIDTTVRRTWQIGADRIRIEGRYWAQALEAIVARCAAGLGLEVAVVPELYKLLVYDKGSFFVSHRDTEKSPGMFATLLIALPSEHSGGELIVRHKDQEVVLDLRCSDPAEVAFAAFYADCLHEVRPVTSGHRVALVYNLLRDKPGPLPRPPDHAKEEAQLAALLRRWSAGRESSDDDTPEKCVYLLEHAYTSAEVSFPALKGADAAAGAVLAAAAQQAGCDLHVALLTIQESGSAEHTGYARSRRRRYEVDEDEFEVGEIFERSALLSDWGRPDGQSAALGSLPLMEEELCPLGALEGMEPDEQYFQEATGNEGASFDRTYRRAALVLWPQQRRLAVFNQAGLTATLPYLADLAARWVESGEGQESLLWREAHELSGHVIHTWPQTKPFRSETRQSWAGDMLSLLDQLQDKIHIDSLAAMIIEAKLSVQGDHMALIQALRHLPSPRAGQFVERVVDSLLPEHPGAGAELLVRAAQAQHLKRHLLAAAEILVDALPGHPARAPQPEFSWRKPSVDSELVVNLMLALGQIDAGLADKVAEHVLAWPRIYSPETILLPAVRHLTQKASTRELAAVVRLRAACVERLRARASEPLQAPSDWTRTAELDCECPHCSELGRFLAAPDRSRWVFKASEFDRSHVMAAIRQHHCDVDCATERSGRPYSLICTKNQASHERRVAQRKSDLDDLAKLV